MFGQKKPTTAKAEKPKKRKGGGGSNDLAAMFGVQMPEDEDDEDYEAELAALEGRPVKKKSAGKKQKAPMSLAEIDKLVSDSKQLGNIDDDDDDDDMDESDLLAELEDLGDGSDEDDTEVETEPVQQQPQPTPRPVQPQAAPRPSQPQAAPRPPQAQAAPPRPSQPQAATRPRPSQPATQPAQTPTAVQPQPPATDSGGGSQSQTRLLLTERMQQYLQASASTSSPADSRKMKVTAAKFQKVIKAYDSGQPIDLSQMPPPPPGFSSKYSSTSQQSPAAQLSSVGARQEAPVVQSVPAGSSSAGPPASATSSAETSAPAIPIPSSLLEGLQQRLEKYSDAQKSAQEAGESSKVRRMGRIVKQYQDAIKATKLKKAFDISELPCPPGYPRLPAPGAAPVAAAPSPASSLGPTSAQPSAPATASQHTASSCPVSEGQQLQPTSAEPNPPAEAPAAGNTAAASSIPVPSTLLEGLQQRLEKYTGAQKSADGAGETSKARRMGRIVKQYQDAIRAAKLKKAFDFSELPCPPGYPPLPAPGAAPVAAPPSPASSLGPTSAQPSAPATAPQHAASSGPVSEGQQLQPTSAEPTPPAEAPAAGNTAAASSIPVPSTLLEGLQQRLEKYTGAQKAADDAGEGAKARRMGRIVKQFQDAIKAAKLKKAFDYSELPCPPGYPPLPGFGPAPAGAAAAPVATSPSGSLQPAVAAYPSSSLQPTVAATGQRSPGPSPASSLNANTVAGGASPKFKSRNEEQLTIVKERHEEYKAAALASKSADRTAEALAYFRAAKGMERMLVAAESGLPVAMSELPAALNPAASNVQQKKRSRTEDDAEVFERLVEALTEQIETCTNNAEQYKRIGDVKGANAFDIEAAGLQADLDMLKNADKYGEAAPRFHYEEREFSLVRAFPDLGDDDCDVVVDCCHSLPLPSGYKEKDLYTYVVVTFPFPHDDEPSEKTHTIKASVNPSYEQSLRFSIDRKARSLVRTIKRHPVKLEVMYEKGFLKSDQSMGVGSIPIGDLETLSEVHASVDLMEGRKACGGKIEARVRFRQPLTGQDIQKSKHRWLVIDDYANLKSTKKTIPPPQAAQRVKQASPSGAASSGKSTSQPLQSIEVLRYEKQRLEKHMAELKSKRQPVPAQIEQRHRAASERAADLEGKLRSGGKAFLQTYVGHLKSGINEQQARARKLLQDGDKSGAQSALMYKKLMSNELEKWSKQGL